MKATKYQMIVWLVALTLSAAAFAAPGGPGGGRKIQEPGWEDEAKVIQATQLLIDLADTFSTGCKDNGDAALDRFVSRVKDFRDKILEMNRLAGRRVGYSNCKSSFIEAAKIFKGLRQEFERNNWYERKPFEIAHAWLKVELAFVEMRYTFTQGYILEELGE